MGVIHFQADSRGNMHWWIEQMVDMSCLPTCAAMAWCLCKGGNCMADPEGSMTMYAAAKGWNPWDGTNLCIGAQILRDVGVNADQPQYFGDELYNQLYLNVWDYSPAIAVVKWGENSGHATLCKHVYSDGLT